MENEKNHEIKTNEYLSQVIHDQKIEMKRKEKKIEPKFYRGMNEDLTKLDIT